MQSVCRPIGGLIIDGKTRLLVGTRGLRAVGAWLGGTGQVESIFDRAG